MDVAKTRTQMRFICFIYVYTIINKAQCCVVKLKHVSINTNSFIKQVSSC